MAAPFMRVYINLLIIIILIIIIFLQILEKL